MRTFIKILKETSVIYKLKGPFYLLFVTDPILEYEFFRLNIVRYEFINTAFLALIINVIFALNLYQCSKLAVGFN